MHYRERSLKRILTIILIIFLSSSCIQLLQEKTIPSLHKHFHNNLKTTKASPISQLNENITYDKNKINLIADYKSYFNEHIILYLINDTFEDVEIPAVGRDINIEYEVYVDNLWLRAKKYQVMHCGNSANTMTIPAQHFILVKGYFSKEGTKVKVRYKLYDKKYSVVSNIGIGYVEDSMIEFAKYDGLSLYYGSFDFVKSIALGEQLPERSTESTRNKAIRYLQWFEADSSEQVLLNLVNDKDLEKEYFDAAFEVLAKFNPRMALRIAHDKIIDHSFTNRIILLSRVAKLMGNDLSRKKSLENFKRSLLLDTLVFKSVNIYKNISEEFIKRKKESEMESIWLSDTTIFNYISYKRFDLKDPAIIEIIKIYSCYQQPDLNSFLKIVLHNHNIDEKIKLSAEALLRQHFRNTSFYVRFEFTKNIDDSPITQYTDYSLTFPLNLIIFNLSDQTLEFSSEDLINGLTLSLKFNDLKYEKRFEKMDFELITPFQYQYEIAPKNELKFSFNLIENIFADSIEYRSYHYHLEGSLYLPEISEIPFYTSSSNSLKIPE